MRALSRRLARDDKGVTALEFAFVGPIFIVMLMALLDMGHMLYAKSVLNGAVQKAGRDSSLQTGIQNAGAIDLAVKNTVLTVVPNAQMTFNRKNYTDFSNIGAPEPFVDTNNNGRRDPGECFQDTNANGIWDTDSSQANQGSASEAAVYTVTLSYTHIFPVATLIGGSPTQAMSVSTMLRNQPYQTAVQPSVICT